MPSDLVCFSHVRWESVRQRPQQLMARAGRSRRVWFVEEAREVVGAPRLQITSVDSLVSVIVPLMPPGLGRADAADLLAGMLGQFLHDVGANHPVIWYDSPIAREFTRHLQAGVVVYDCTEERSPFDGAPRARKVWESELLEAADLVFTDGDGLFRAMRTQHPNVFDYPSSVDADHFGRARRPQREPDDQRHVPRPRVGFLGELDERLDLELLHGLARTRPGYSFVLIGPAARIPAERLPQAINLYYLGMKSYDELPFYLAGWDVAMLPFAANAATRGISPAHAAEYLAAGRPVVSTSTADVVRAYGHSGLVRVADDVESFAAAIDASVDGVDRAWLDAVDEHLSTISWDRTWDRMHARIRQVEQQRATGVPEGVPVPTRHGAGAGPRLV